jgi:hypothetical protein
MRFFRAKYLMTWGAALVIALMAITTFLAVLCVQVYMDQAFICENTGSHKGYRQWPFGLQSGRWYRESHLEQFMRREHPSDLVNRWTSYAGTGKNILGRSMVFSHAFPGPILGVNTEFFDRYVDSLDNQAKLDLYHVLASGTPAEVKVEIDKVWERAIAEEWELQRERRDRR